MPSINNKAYDQAVRMLDRLKDGLQRHEANPRLAAILGPSGLELLKSELVILRKTYLEQENRAREAYEQFNVKFKEVQQRISNETRVIKGVLNPRSEELLDFGILPEKAKSQKRPEMET